MDEREIRDTAQRLRADAARMRDLVPVQELAGRLGVPLESLMQGIGEDRLERTWDGHLGVPVELAAEMVSASQREAASNAAKQAAAEAAGREREARRAAIGQLAYERAHAAELEEERKRIRAAYDGVRGVEFVVTCPTARQAGREAREAALAESDRKNH